jgi:hypothetical protein
MGDELRVASARYNGFRCSVLLASAVDWDRLPSVMKRPSRKRKKLDYPVETNGTRWAAEARRLASKMTPAARAEHFRKAMVKIYGGQPKETTGAGR